MKGPVVAPDGRRKSSLSGGAGDRVESERSATGEILLRDSGDRDAEFDV